MISAVERPELMPTGKLRVGIIYTNPATLARDPADSCIADDLAREFGQTDRSGRRFCEHSHLISEHHCYAAVVRWIRPILPNPWLFDL